MAGTITTGNIPRLVQEGINKVFGNTYDKHEKQFDKIFDTFGSTKNFEIDQQVEGFALAPEKTQGDEISFDSFAQGFSPKYPALTYAKGFIATKEAIADELYGVLNKKAGALAFSMTQTKEVVAANVINRGFNSSFLMTDGDGVELFSTAHINGPSGGTFSNKLAVDANLSEQALEDMLINIGNTKDPRGLNIKIIGTKLIVPVALQFEAQRLLMSVLQSGTANNDDNAVRSMNSIRDNFTVNNYLTDTNAWFIKTNAPEGLKYFTRQAVEFGEDNAFTSGNARMKADERYSFGWTEPRGIHGTSGA